MMKSLRSSMLLGAMAVALPLTATAADPAAGKKIATTVCAACHGANGIATIPMYPNLAGQNEAYLVSSLKAYQAKQRTGAQAALMQGQAAALSDTDIANVSAYYASLDAKGQSAGAQGSSGAAGKQGATGKPGSGTGAQSGGAAKSGTGAASGQSGAGTGGAR